MKRLEIINNRSCDGCTKCCEGWLSATIYGKQMYRGRPCHFKSQNGCSIYEGRPEDPCKKYSCGWLEILDVPEWMKPNLVNAIISKRKNDSLEWLELTEAGSKLDSSVLSWFFMYCMNSGINFSYQVDAAYNYFGSKEFLEFMSNSSQTINK